MGYFDKPFSSDIPQSTSVVSTDKKELTKKKTPRKFRNVRHQSALYKQAKRNFAQSFAEFRQRIAE